MSLSNFLEIIEDQIKKNQNFITQTKAINSFEEYKYRLGYLHGLKEALEVLLTQVKKEHEYDA